MKNRHHRFCYECKRVIPTKKHIFVRHNIQGKGWVNSFGKKDECPGSGTKAAPKRR